MSKKTALTTFPASLVRILLGSDERRRNRLTHRVLTAAGFRVDMAEGYEHLEEFWQQGRHEIVLLEISRRESLNRAIDLGIRLKQRDARQFIGYLADPAAHGSGLEGAIIFPRDSHRLPSELRRFFGPQIG